MSNEITNLLQNIHSQGRTVLNYEESRKIMELADIPLNKMVFAKDLDECLIKANEIGYPVVLKIVSEDVVHKSDSGGVKVGINSPEELQQSHDEMLESVLKFYPSAKIDGFSIEEMVKGVELLIGANTDEQFGKMIALGIGGIFVEVYQDVSFRLIPVSDTDVKEMITEIKGKKLFEGFRGMPIVNIDELVSLVIKISKLVEKYPIIKEMDLNPIMATEKGLRAIDARVILE